MANAEYLLDSFPAFAARRNETHVRTQTAIDWAAHGPSARNATSGLKRSAGSPVTSAPKMIGTGCLPRTTLDTASRAACRTSTHPTKWLPSRSGGPAPSSWRDEELDIHHFDRAAGVHRLRVSEALGLRFADITDDGLLIRETKFQRPVWCHCMTPRPRGYGAT